MNKKKILFCSEATYLSTGYATVYGKMLNDFFKSNKYEIAEHASYARIDDPRIKNIPWKLYCNTPAIKDSEQRKIYDAATVHKFGSWRFNHVVNDFRPDIVIGMRDPYMDAHIVNSPLAPYYHSILVPPIDSLPPKDEYLDIYSRANTVFAQTEHGYNVLKQYIPSANCPGIAGGGVDMSIYYPQSKSVVRQKYGINENLYIIGMVARNQVRKLFDNLIVSFKKFLEFASPDIQQKSFLYLHTAYPEKAGWNLAKIIKESGVGHKIIFSYQCRLCKHSFCSIFQDARIICPKCSELAAVTVTSDTGYTKQQMAEIYNCMDLCVNISVTEGQGITPIEAAACGIPVASVNFGPMGEVISNIGGYLIDSESCPRDLNNDSYRVFPDNNSIINSFYYGLNHKVNLSEQIANVKKHYDFNNTPQKIMAYIDGLNLKNKWNDDFTYETPVRKDIFKMSDDEFLNYIFGEICGNIQLKYTYLGKCAARDLHYGVDASGGSYTKVSRPEILKRFERFAGEKKYWERVRLGLEKAATPDYIMFANRRKGNE